MKTYDVIVIKEAGLDLITRQSTDQESELLTVEANNPTEAYRRSLRESSLRFMGQTRRTFIDGQEYLGS